MADTKLVDPSQLTNILNANMFSNSSFKWSLNYAENESSGIIAREFLGFLERFLDFLCLSKYTLFMSGGFNINMSSNEKPLCELSSRYASYGVFSVITDPTRVTRNFSNLIGLFLTNADERYISAGVILTDISDHFPIFLLSQK